MKRFRAMLAFALAVVILSAETGFAAYTTLRYKDSGSDVQKMQTALTSLGYNPGAADGRFGYQTEEAVKKFQRDHGLTADGLAGHRTLTKLYELTDGNTVPDTSDKNETAAPAPSVKEDSTGAAGDFGGNYDTLRYGMSGMRVKALQAALNQLGYNCGSADGKFGAGTQRAVTAFQRANGLTADGLAGSKTLKRIEQQLSSGGTTAPEEPEPEETPAEKPEDTSSGVIIPTRTMRKGCTGDDVKSVQTRLQQLGYFTGAIDGQCSSSMIAAVKAFQQRNGLTADGLAGTKTYQILYSDKAVPAETQDAPEKEETPSETVDPSTIILNRTLYRGATGDDVYSVTLRLKMFGYLQEASRTYDADVMAAVKAFQKDVGLTADGYAGPKTFEKLYADNPELPEDSSGDNIIPTEYRTLKKGMEGSDVTALQAKLKELKYTLSQTGTYDDQTVTAVRLFQRLNDLSVDGVAGKLTQEKLYSGDCVTGDTVLSGSSASGVAPNGAKIQLLHWVNDIKPVLKTGQNLIVYEPESGISFTLYVMSRGRHCDVEPLTSADTALMMQAWNNVVTWTPKAVYVKLPDGRWTMATMHNVAHGSQVIKDNDFDGQNCVHFLRDMAEAERNDPKYGVQNQQKLREAWKALTGEVVE